MFGCGGVKPCEGIDTSIEFVDFRRYTTKWPSPGVTEIWKYPAGDEVARRCVEDLASQRERPVVICTGAKPGNIEFQAVHDEHLDAMLKIVGHDKQVDE